MTPDPAGHQNSPIACRISALDLNQRIRREELLLQLRSLIQEVIGISDGHAFRFDEEQGSLLKIAEFVELERRCCPFLRFEVELTEEGGPTWLRLRGRPGVKEFLAAELGIEN